jgi:hypothetical protein
MTTHTTTATDTMATAIPRTDAMWKISRRMVKHIEILNTTEKFIRARIQIAISTYAHV